MHIVLVEPEIPPNTGNVARLCAATRTTLHLVEPFGFELDDQQLKRAGMDYWRQVEWHRWPNWTEFQKQLRPNARLWFIESCGAPSNVSHLRFRFLDQREYFFRFVRRGEVLTQFRVADEPADAREDAEVLRNGCCNEQEEQFRRLGVDRAVSDSRLVPAKDDD